MNVTGNHIFGLERNNNNFKEIDAHVGELSCIINIYNIHMLIPDFILSSSRNRHNSFVLLDGCHHKVPAVCLFRKLEFTFDLNKFYIIIAKYLLPTKSPLFFHIKITDGEMGGQLRLILCSDAYCVVSDSK